MAYTAVKLADVNKAIAAVKTAQSNYATSLSSTTPSQTALETAKKNFDTATAKLQSMRDDLDRQTYLQNNSSYNNALDAAKTAEQKLNEAKDFLDSGRYYRDNSTYNNDVNAFNSANDKLNQLRDFKDSGQYLRNNSAYQNAVNAIEPKINALREAENKLDNWSGNRSGSAWNSAVTAKVNASKTVDAAYTARDKAEQAASTAADTLVRNQENTLNAAETKFNKTRETLESTANKARETAEKTLDLSRQKIDTVRDTSRETAEKTVNAQDQTIYKSNGIQSLYDQAKDKYQNVVDQTQSNLDAYKDTKNNVFNYVNDIKNSLGDVNTKEDATAVKTLLSQIETSINGTGISDFKNEVAPLIKEIDPLKMANITTPDTSNTKPLSSAFKNASPSNFSNIDPNTGLPILNQEALDRVLSKYGDNSLTSSQYRANYNAFGWNVKSDASSVTRGAALVGLDIGNIPSGGLGQTTKEYVKAGTNNPASDADFKKVAENLGLDVNNYIQPNKFVPTSSTYGGTEHATNKNSKEYTNPNTGETYLARIDAKGNFTTSVDKKLLYSEIDDRLKDFYVVGNVLEAKGANKASPHAAVLFKADGSGNLVPVTKQDGSVAASYYNAAYVTHTGWKGQLAELAPLIAVVSSIFLPGIGAALAQSIGSATVATAAAVAPTAFTVGLPATAISLSSVIGATGVSALTGSIINGGMAFLTGGDVGRAMLSGAAGAAAAVSAGDISNKIMGGGQTGTNNVAAIAKAANLSVSQTEKIIASGFASGLTSAVTDPDNAFKNMAISIASNFTSEEAKNIVSGSVDPKSVNGVTTFVSKAVDLGTSALMSGQDVGKVLQDAAPSLAVGAAKAEFKYAPPVSTGAFGFPLSPDRYETAQKEINTYYKDLLNSDFDENVVTQLKKAYPDLPESEVYQKAKDITGDFAAQIIGESIGDVSQGTLDYLFSSIASNGDPIKDLTAALTADQVSSIPEYIQNITGLKPDFNESGNGIKERIEEYTNPNTGTKQKFVTYEQTISGKTKDGKEYGFTAVYDPDSHNVYYTTGYAPDPEEMIPDAENRLPTSLVQVLDIRPNFNNLDSSEIPAPFIPFEIPPQPPQKDLTYLLSEHFSKDQGVMSHYIKEAGNALTDSGIPNPSQQEISKYAMDMLRGDVSNIFGYSPSTSSGKEKSDAGVPEGLPEGLPEGMPGGTLDGSLEGSKTGGTGTGAGTGGDGGAAAEKAARAKRQNYYNKMTGVASLPTVSTPASTKQTSPSQAFYYGKDFGSPTQAISETGDLVQKPYQALSVTQPGKEVAPTGVTGENDVSALLSNILSQGDETSLNDLLEIIGGSQYG